MEKLPFSSSPFGQVSVFVLHSRTEKLKPKLRQFETTLLSNSEVVFHRLSSEKVLDSLVSKRIMAVKKLKNQHMMEILFFCV